MSFDAPSPVIAGLEHIDADLAERQNKYEQAADDRARLVRDWDYRLALHRVKAQGRDADTRKATALVAAIEQDNLYERLKDAEARFEAMKAAINTMSTRTTIGQSILKAQGRG